MGPTPSQTVGPFFAIGLPFDSGPFVAPEGTLGAFWIRGTVVDGAGDPVSDALVETWQTGPDGSYSTPGAGFGRCATDEKGGFGIHTVKPGAANGAPHVEVALFARGLLKQLYTRIYFDDEAAANAGDPVLAAIEDVETRSTLVAETAADGYRFDVHLQGERETVFFPF